MDMVSSAIAAAAVLLAVVIAVAPRGQAAPEDGARRRGPPGEAGEEPPHPPVAPPGHRHRHLHRLPLLPEGLPGGGHPRASRTGTATLVHADHCIGHGRCAAECPVQAIRLVMGTARARRRPARGRRVLRVEPARGPRGGRAGRDGAPAQRRPAGAARRQAARRRSSPRASGGEGGGDVVIVGAGAAGLATACALHEAGRSYRLLEQGTWGGTMYHYPRRKIVMTEPATHPGLRQDREVASSARRSCSRPGARPSRRSR